MLRLLAQREEGYEDIAALKGLSLEEVRAEVKDALAQLAEDREAGLEPPSVSEPPRAEEPRKVEEPHEAEEPPEPPKQEPKPAQAAPPPQPGPSAPAKPPARRPRPAVPPERRRLLILTGGALGVVAVVLIAIAVFSGSSDSSSSGSGGSAAEGVATEGAESGKITQAVLKPVAGGSGSGQAVFGRLGKEVVLQVTAEGLDPTAKGESYTVWLYRTPKLTLRVGSVGVGESGKLGARFPIPTELLAYVASGAFDQIYVSRTSDAAYRSEVVQAKKNKSLPRYTGETVLTGEITGPVVKGASR
jgi:hypothetical protein